MSSCTVLEKGTLGNVTLMVGWADPCCFLGPEIRSVGKMLKTIWLVVVCVLLLVGEDAVVVEVTAVVTVV